MLTNIVGASWRTTILGILGLVSLAANVAQLILDGDATTNPDWATVIPMAMALIGSLFARDNKVTSEAAGAVK